MNARVARGEVNDVPAVPTRSVRDIVRANVFTRFNALLGAMLAVIAVVGPIQDMLFGGVLVANALVGIIQELRAKRTLDRLTVLTAPKARIVRDGVIAELPVESIVIDDVLEIHAGDQIVVDGEILDSDGAEIDESLLTGESDPVSKRAGDQVLSGSFLIAGTGHYRATKVGRDAYAVRLAEEARRFTLTRSELRTSIDYVLRLITWAIVPAAGLLFVTQIGRADVSLADALRSAVAGTVGMVPEGLVLLTSIAFAVGVIRLARLRLLVQELPAVEGLARVDVLCIDKTGTLTEGRLVVDTVEVLDDAIDPYPALGALAAADSTPNATLLAIGEGFPDKGWEAESFVPFSSARRWSGAGFGEHGAWILGAPEVIAAAMPDMQRILDRSGEHAAQGGRVLLLARSEGSPLDGVLPSELEAAALVVIADQPREDAAEILRYFAEQDVTVKILSGDHPATVGAIAERLGAHGADHPMDAGALPEEQEALADALEAHHVFGRVSPQQKQAIVKALQSRGHVVAMTGDGVNDALALKYADIGVAMGSGAPATRAVAQLVLLDSNFAALPEAVLEGRRVLGNIERTAGLYLTKTVYAMLLALAVGVAGLPFPFLPRHLTLIGSLTIGIPSFFLALEPNFDRFRPGFLTRVAHFSLSAGALAAIATFLAYRVAGGEPGVTLIEQRTTATMVLTWIGLLVLTTIAAPLTGRRFALIWTMVGIFLAIIFSPPGTEIFALDAPPFIVWLAGFGIAAIVWSFARMVVPGEGPVGQRR